MNNYYNSNSWENRSTSGPIINTRSANAFMQRVFTIMTAGLAITGLTAYGFAGYLSQNPEMIATIFGSPLKWLVMFAPFVFVLILSFGIQRLSYMAATLVFGGYALVMGISLSTIFLVYTGSSIATTFFVTGGTFGAMALLGATTKMDLTKLGSYLMMALIGIIIASFVNFFVGSSTMGYVISFAGVIIFSGLTAYDTQKILEISRSMTHDSEAARKASLMGALSLYLDFINLFLFLLRFLGSSRD